MDVSAISLKAKKKKEFILVGMLNKLNFAIYNKYIKLHIWK